MTNLTPYELERKKMLQEKLHNRVLSVPEADELRNIIEKEQQQATSTGDWKKALGALLLLGLLLAFLKDK